VRRKGRRNGGCLGESKMQAHFREPFIERLKLYAFRFVTKGTRSVTTVSRTMRSCSTLLMSEIVQKRIRGQLC
jgi:hypothetical protein